MSYFPLSLLGIAYLSPVKEPAVLRFTSGLNGVFGASDTGKSIVLETIDFLLGASTLIRDVPERNGYDRVRLVLKTGESLLTLERSLSGGDILLFEGNELTRDIDDKAQPLKSKHSSKKDNSISTFLLSKIGLDNKTVRKNSKGDVQGLSFRNLARFVVINEDEIIKRSSPVLSDQYMSATSEYSAFKLLLTGVDDSSLAQNKARQAQIVSKQRISAKIDLINDLIVELQGEIEKSGLDRKELEDKISQIHAYSERQQNLIVRLRQDLEEKVELRNSILKEQNNIKLRVDEINALLSRFNLLKEHYQADLQRLEAIAETGSLFIYLEQKSCPLCGANSEEQHQNENCDGNISSVVIAAYAEIDKIKKLRADLELTLDTLRQEKADLAQREQELLPSFRQINEEIKKCSSPLENAQSTFSQILTEANNAQSELSRFARIDEFRAKKNALELEANNTDVPEIIQTDFSKSVLDEYCQKIQQILAAWNFPGAERVYFDETAKDIVINGQLRTSRGKGLRSITYTAMAIGLLEFCRERNLSHPGFIILDSPLVAYYAPEGTEDSLEGTGLDKKFYTYLSENHKDSQIIIVDNPLPPDSIIDSISATIFTKNPHQGRYGLFPL